MADKSVSIANGAVKPEEPALSPKTIDKYKAAADVAASALKAVIEAVKEGASVLDLCKLGDQKIEEGITLVYNKKGSEKVTKGLAHPTCLSVNAVLQNFSPLPSDEVAGAMTLKKDDVVKIVLGAHIDGYATLDGETVVVGASSVTGIRADLIAAARNVAEAALRSVKVGARNWEVTDAITKVLAEYEGVVKGVEGVFSNQHLQNDLQAKKTISVFPSSEQRADKDNSCIIEEGDVYTLNVLVTNSEEPKAKQSDHLTTIYGKTTAKYQLKMTTSRAVFAEISKKAGDFPFTLRILENEKRGKLGVQECVQHALLTAHTVTTTGSIEKDLSAQALITFAATKTGPIRLTHAPRVHTGESLKPDHEIKNEEVKALLARGLKATKPKKPKADAPAAA